jgi:DNA-binding GntR family transcriptional regulator
VLGQKAEKLTMTATAFRAGVQINGSDRSRSEDVYLQLKQDIVEFKLLPGCRFTEIEQSERLGVSRTPIRQALYRLQQEGYVEVFFRSGWRVLPFDFRKYEQLYELRMILEAAAVQMLCERSHAALTDALHALSLIWLVPESSRSQEGRQVSLWDEEFHCALVVASGNQEMVRVHHEITEKIRVIRRLDFDQSKRLTATYDEHGAILRSILTHDSRQAVVLLRSHIASSQSEVRKITLHQLQMAQQDG